MEVKFKMGTSDKVKNVGPEAGSILVATDTGEMFVDITNSHNTTERLSVGGKQDIDLPLYKGNGINSLVINDGDASGNYSIAGGTTDKEFVEQVIGETSAAITKLNPSKATGPLSISLGADNNTQSAGSIAIGYNNITGAKGYYFDSIDFKEKKITLSNTRRNSALTNMSYPSLVTWNAGDILFIVNKEKY